MTSTVAKERIAVVVATLVLLWTWELTVPHVAAAVFGIAFFWWFTGKVGGAPNRQ